MNKILFWSDSPALIQSNFTNIDKVNW